MHKLMLYLFLFFKYIIVVANVEEPLVNLQWALSVVDSRFFMNENDIRLYFYSLLSDSRHTIYQDVIIDEK